MADEMGHIYSPLDLKTSHQLIISLIGEEFHLTTTTLTYLQSENLHPSLDGEGYYNIPRGINYIYY